jgi:hypothetical protein
LQRGWVKLRLRLGPIILLRAQCLYGYREHEYPRRHGTVRCVLTEPAPRRKCAVHATKNSPEPWSGSDCGSVCQSMAVPPSFSVCRTVVPNTCGNAAAASERPYLGALEPRLVASPSKVLPARSRTCDQNALIAGACCAACRQPTVDGARGSPRRGLDGLW